MSNIDLAIKYAKEHQQIHQDWLDFWAANGYHESDPQAVAGGPQHHFKAILRYNIIIQALQEKK